jgi:Short C-terminal domain
MMRRRRGPGLIGAMARTAVVAGTASAVHGRVQHRQQQRWAAQEQQEYEAQAYEQQAYQQQAAAAAAPAEPEYMAELEQLAQFRDQGILTPEEFEAKKKQILGL